MSLSEFDYMLKVRLPNWGRWGRQDSCRPDPEAGSGSIYEMGRADREGDGEEAPEELPPGIDSPDAEALDAYITRLGLSHKHVIIQHFYKRKEGMYPHVHAAVRALLDMETV